MRKKFVYQVKVVLQYNSQSNSSIRETKLTYRADNHKEMFEKVANYGSTYHRLTILNFSRYQNK